MFFYIADEINNNKLSFPFCLSTLKKKQEYIYLLFYTLKLNKNLIKRDYRAIG